MEHRKERGAGASLNASLYILISLHGARMHCPQTRWPYSLIIGDRSSVML